MSKRTLKRAGALLLLAVVAALVVAAATSRGRGQRPGASSQGTPVTSPVASTPAAVRTPAPPRERTPTAAEYRSRATALCAQMPTETPASSLQQAAPQIRRLAATAEDVIGQLQALPPPPEQAAGVHRALAIMRDELGVVEQVANAAAADDRTGTASAFRRVVALGQAEHDIWAKIGVSRC